MSKPDGVWKSADQVPDQGGKLAVVTGANSGLGLESARVLAARNATVVMAVRNTAKGEAARENILATLPDAADRLLVMQVDVGSMASVRAFADAFAGRFNRLDILMLNAGVMASPFERTDEGLERQMAVNHFGHFAMTGLLLPLIEATPGARIVTVSSSAMIAPSFDPNDLNWEKRRYEPWMGYGQSKMAAVVFAVELNRRLQAAGIDAAAMSVEPGLAATNLQHETERMGTRGAKIFSRVLVNMRQPAHMGALPQLRAATDPDATGSEFFRPQIPFMRGPAVAGRVPGKARNDALRARFWAESERLTGVRYLSEV